VEARNSQFSCFICGAELDVPEAQTAATIAGDSGRPTIRILSVNGREVHRCGLQSLAPRAF
jgi:hypothetical protein